MHPRLLAIILLLSPFSTVDLSAAKPSREAGSRSPNILFIAVDDLRPELGCFGVKPVLSPNIDRLAARGTLFRRAYCQQAVCSPSRTSLMTGLRPDSTGVFDLVTHFRKKNPDVVTLAQHFKENGYLSLSMGKIYHGGYDDAPSWSEPALKPAGGEGYALAENRDLIARKNAEGKKKGLKGKTLSRAARGPAVEMADVPDEAYTDGAVAALGVQTLARCAKQDAPFFLAVGFLKPHLPFNAPKKYWDLYDREAIPMAANPFPPKNAPEEALTSWGEMRNYEGIPAKGPVTDTQARELKHGYYACVSFTDANVGKLLDELDRLKLTDNTIVVLWGDHGWKLGEHGAWCKHTNFENDTRAPLIVAAPGQSAAGRPSDALVEFVDIYPSLCDLAGLSQPAHLEGTSFAPLLDNPDLPWKRAAFSQYPRGNTMGYTLTDGDHRFTLWVDAKNHEKILATELYDHTVDPAENENVAADPRHAALVKKLTAWSRAGWQETREELLPNSAGSN